MLHGVLDPEPGKLVFALFDGADVRRLALNECDTDTRCDGLTLGLFRKLEKKLDYFKS